MKYLVFLLALVISFSACGGDDSVMFSDGFDQWYEEFYAECVELCDLCAKSDETPEWYDKQLCLEVVWNYGQNNAQCHDRIDNINASNCMVSTAEDPWW